MTQNPGTPTATRLTTAMDTPNPSTRLQVAQIAGTRPDPAYIPVLIEQCRTEPDFNVRDMLTWALIMVVPVAIVGATPAMVLLGLRVVRLDRPEKAGVGLLWTLVRTLSVFFVIPALIVDRDSRGVQDRASRTVVVRTR